jgi:hypothetical protein
MQIKPNMNYSKQYFPVIHLDNVVFGYVKKGHDIYGYWKKGDHSPIIIYDIFHSRLDAVIHAREKYEQHLLKAQLNT